LRFVIQNKAQVCQSLAISKGFISVFIGRESLESRFTMLWLLASKHVSPARHAFN
jgi:hypothetical protein